MMESLPRTPSPSADVHTPPAPRHGYLDAFEPYSPKRKSARLAQRSEIQVGSHISSSEASTRHYSNTYTSPRGSPQQQRRSKKTSAAMASSPTASPQKKRMPAMESSRRASGALTAESAATAAAALGLPAKPEMKIQRPSRPAISNSTTGMLPTPAKTPQKPPSEENKANIKAIARSLFHNEGDIMPKPKKTRSKAAYVLDSFSADDAEEPIQIYTDSHERVPEIDNSAENPFYSRHPATTTAAAAPAAVPEPAKRRSTRQTRMISIPGEGKVSVDEALHREDGMVATFRGKRIFRKFADLDDASSTHGDEGAEAENSLDSTVEPHLRRPLTRSSVKPRLLFPPKPVAIDKTDDEEAATDIEDHALPEGPETPVESLDKAPDTPGTPRFAPASPPATTRVTRQGAKNAEDLTPIKAKNGGGSKGKLFDAWLRTKGGSQSHGLKRSANPLEGESAKRTKA